MARATWQCGPGCRELTRRTELLALGLTGESLEAEGAVDLR